MIREVAFGSSSASADSQPVDAEISIREVVNNSGRGRESPALDMKLVKAAKRLYMLDHPDYSFPRKTIWCNGQTVVANRWLESQRGYIEQALASL